MKEIIKIFSKDPKYIQNLLFWSKVLTAQHLAHPFQFTIILQTHCSPIPMLPFIPLGPYSNYLTSLPKLLLNSPVSYTVFKLTWFTGKVQYYSVVFIKNVKYKCVCVFKNKCFFSNLENLFRQHHQNPEEGGL